MSQMQKKTDSPFNIARLGVAAAAIENAPNPVMIKNTQGAYIYVNAMFEKYFQKSRLHVLGRTAAQIWGGDLANNAMSADAELLKQKTSIAYTTTVQLDDGPPRDWHVSKYLIELPDGEAGIVAFYTDVSEHLEVKRKLEESEERYRLASQHAGIWDWDMQSGKLYVSPAFARSLGWPDTDAAHITLEEINALFHPDDLDHHFQLIDRIFAREVDHYDNEHRFRMPDGDYRWFRSIGSAVRDDQGRTTRMTGMITDIDTERRNADELRISERRIASLLDNSPAAIYFKDADLRFVMANKRYQEVYGFCTNDIIGKTSAELFGDQMGEEFTGHDREVFVRRTPITREERIGGAIYLTTKFPIIDDDGELVGIGGIETDISQRVEDEQMYREARDEAEAANRAKSAFLANMSHELRTPLNSVIGFSDSLLEGTLGEIHNHLHREYLVIIRTAGEHLLNLINDILDLSRIEAGKMELDETQFDILDVFNSTLRLTSERAGTAGILIFTEIDDNVPKLIADERQIQQVLINLVSNAIKFTDPGGRITMSALKTNNGEFEIRVSDTGIGISAEDLERIQQPFVQVADAMTRQHSGSGLGLAIVRSIATLHGGTFDIESTPGQGTTGKVTLPANRTVRKKA